jgi:hypothetical protein
MDTKQYISEFLKAEAWSIKERLGPTQLSFQPKRYFDPSAPVSMSLLENSLKHGNIGEAATVMFEKLGFLSDAKNRRGQCCAAHVYAKLFLDIKFNTKTCFTVGYVETGQDTHWPTSHTDLRKRASSTKASDKVTLHAWLTFDSGEILDFTFSTVTLAGCKIGNLTANDVVCGYPWETHGLNYRPVATGSQLVRYLKVIDLG